MHPSEQFTGNVERHVRSSPGVYVLVVVEALLEDEDDYPECTGWAILRKTGE